MSVCSLRAISQFYKVHHHRAKKRDVFELFSPVLTKTLTRSIDGNAIASFTEHAQYQQYMIGDIVVFKYRRFGKTSFTLRRKAMTEKKISHYSALKSEFALFQTSSRLFHSLQFIKCRGIFMKLNSYGPYSSLMFSLSLSFFFLLFCLQIMTIHSLLSVGKVGVSE